MKQYHRCESSVCNIDLPCRVGLLHNKFIQPATSCRSLRIWLCEISYQPAQSRHRFLPLCPAGAQEIHCFLNRHPRVTIPSGIFCFHPRMPSSKITTKVEMERSNSSSVCKAVIYFPTVSNNKNHGRANVQTFTAIAP